MLAINCRHSLEEVATSFPMEDLNDLANKTFKFPFKIGTTLNCPSSWIFSFENDRGNIIPVIKRTSENCGSERNVTIDVKISIMSFLTCYAKCKNSQDINMDSNHEYKFSGFTTEEALGLISPCKGVLNFVFVMREALSPSVYSDAPVTTINLRNRVAEFPIPRPSRSRKTTVREVFRSKPIKTFKLKGPAPRTTRKHDIESDAEEEGQETSKISQLSKKPKQNFVKESRLEDIPQQTNVQLVADQIAAPDIPNNNGIPSTHHFKKALASPVEPSMGIKYCVDQSTIKFPVADLQLFSILSEKELCTKYGQKFKIGQSIECETTCKLFFLKTADRALSIGFELADFTFGETDKFKLEVICTFLKEKKEIIWRSHEFLHADGTCNKFLLPTTISLDFFTSFANIRGLCAFRIMFGVMYDVDNNILVTSSRQRDRKFKTDYADLLEDVSDAEHYVSVLDDNGHKHNNYVHGAIMVARCPSLRLQMHNAETDGKIDPKPLDFLTTKTFYIFAKYCYTGEIDESWKLYPIQLMHAAHRYRLPELLHYFIRNAKQAETAHNKLELKEVVQLLGTNLT